MASVGQLQFTHHDEQVEPHREHNHIFEKDNGGIRFGWDIADWSYVGRQMKSRPMLFPQFSYLPEGIPKAEINPVFNMEEDEDKTDLDDDQKIEYMNEIGENKTHTLKRLAEFVEESRKKLGAREFKAKFNYFTKGFKPADLLLLQTKLNRRAAAVQVEKKTPKPIEATPGSKDVEMKGPAVVTVPTIPKEPLPTIAQLPPKVGVPTIPLDKLPPILIEDAPKRLSPPRKPSEHELEVAGLYKEIEAKNARIADLENKEPLQVVTDVSDATLATHKQAIDNLQAQLDNLKRQHATDKKEIEEAASKAISETVAEAEGVIQRTQDDAIAGTNKLVAEFKQAHAITVKQLEAAGVNLQAQFIKTDQALAAIANMESNFHTYIQDAAMTTEKLDYLIRIASESNPDPERRLNAHTFMLQRIESFLNAPGERLQVGITSDANLAALAAGRRSVLNAIADDQRAVMVKRQGQALKAVIELNASKYRDQIAQLEGTVDQYLVEIKDVNQQQIDTEFKLDMAGLEREQDNIDKNISLQTTLATSFLYMKILVDHFIEEEIAVKYNRALGTVSTDLDKLKDMASDYSINVNQGEDFVQRRLAYLQNQLVAYQKLVTGWIEGKQPIPVPANVEVVGDDDAVMTDPQKNAHDRDVESSIVEHPRVKQIRRRPNK